MMHGIAQLAVFCNCLPGLRAGGMVRRFITAGTNKMLVGIYHILPGRKAQQQ